LIITEIRKLLNGVILLHLKRTPTSSSCNFGEGEEEAACAAMCRLLSPHKPSTCFHPRDFTGTAGTECGQSVSVCELGADGLRLSRMGEWQFQVHGQSKR